MLCRLSDTGFRRNAHQTIHYTFHKFSFIGIRPNRSNQLLLGKQFQPKQYLLQVFSKIIWNVWARHPECNCGSTIITSEENNQHEYWLRGHIKYPWFPGGGWWWALRTLRIIEGLAFIDFSVWILMMRSAQREIPQVRLFTWWPVQWELWSFVAASVTQSSEDL